MYSLRYLCVLALPVQKKKNTTRRTRSYKYSRYITKEQYPVIIYISFFYFVVVACICTISNTLSTVQYYVLLYTCTLSTHTCQHYTSIFYFFSSSLPFTFTLHSPALSLRRCTNVPNESLITCMCTCTHQCLVKIGDLDGSSSSDRTKLRNFTPFYGQKPRPEFRHIRSRSKSETRGSRSPWSVVDDAAAMDEEDETSCSSRRATNSAFLPSIGKSRCFNSILS